MPALLTMLSDFLLLFLLLPLLVRANTEKTIFLGPPTVNIPSSHPTLDALLLDVLRPQTLASSVIRTTLNASFPQSSPYLASLGTGVGGRDVDYSDKDYGTPSWLILDDLVPGQRYEVRVCWAATQPTAFKLETFELDKVFGTPELISSLSAYSYARHNNSSSSAAQQDTAKIRARDSNGKDDTEHHRSVLFLRIFAAADYFTLHKGLMTTVPPVRVDVILDPFLLNVLPRSLLPIVGYIIIVAVGSWFLAKNIAGALRHVALQTDLHKKAQ
ncbi:hypothetical protein Micbo1qcDRAFT_230076 [Microdochium bolleyi]|uniref:Uncharacterized protein n=1 Tax=Microdochium bolleyi TaxID=196109 RepID=A0A136JJU3_9PEZI|nr:hypothetical protein Micbo1qcDRAFT_230076 [Microdochium bolleyi]